MVTKQPTPHLHLIKSLKVLQSSVSGEKDCTLALNFGGGAETEENVPARFETSQIHVYNFPCSWDSLFLTKYSWEMSPPSVTFGMSCNTSAHLSLLCVMSKSRSPDTSCCKPTKEKKSTTFSPPTHSLGFTWFHSLGSTWFHFLGSIWFHFLGFTWFHDFSLQGVRATLAASARPKHPDFGGTHTCKPKTKGTSQSPP